MHHESELVLVVDVIDHAAQSESHEVLHDATNLTCGVQSALDAAVSEEVLVGQSAAGRFLLVDLVLGTKRQAIADFSQLFYNFLNSNLIANLKIKYFLLNFFQIFDIKLKTFNISK